MPVASLAALAFAAGACHRAASADGGDGDAAQAAAIVSGSSAAAAWSAAPPAADAPKLGAIAMQAWIHERPTATSRRLGYLRLGALVAREAEPAGNDGCAGGWFKIYPRGFVCVGDKATLDLKHPLLRAALEANAHPDLSKPLPYKYGFVRAVSPLYLKIPNRKEQSQAEFGLDLHLEWWRSDEGKQANSVVLGANDVPLDERGVAIAGQPIGAVPRKSTDMTQGELFGGKADDEPIPFWLPPPSFDRTIPNVSGFEVPPKSVYANRVRRHTGLAFIGSFSTGDDAYNRRFAITTDLRLVPTSKVKPDTASAWHGVEITDATPLPFAWIRTLKPAPVYRAAGSSKVEKTDETIARRSIVRFTGNLIHGKTGLYRELAADGGGASGRWVNNADVGIVTTPKEWPDAAKNGEKWIEVSIENQTLTLWEGKKPIYATLVSTGQDGMDDWRTTKSTIRGTFRIRTKHVTTTMDSNGKGAEGGENGGAMAEKAVDKDGASKGDGDKDDGAKKGGGAFELRDVPWVQYFEAGFALHAAYWHDVFGSARSHGCINLSPIDAHRVFQWTEPSVPEGWHGVTAKTDVNPGTTIVIHR